MARRSWRYLTLVLVASLLVVAAVALAGELALRQSGDGPMCRGERATIVGTAGVDRLVGTPRRDVIVAGPGGDVVLARGGNDVVCDREGADRVIGGRGDDEIGGGSGADRLTAGRGDDWLAGRRGTDTMLGGRGNDRLFGERGDDALRGNAGDDLLAGGADRDSCIGGAGTDVMVDCESGDQGSDLPAPSPGGGQPPGGPPPISNRAPSGVSLSAAVVAENEPIGTTVGDLSAGDPDPGDTHSFALVPGAGSDDNGSFQIIGNTLRTNAVFDYEAKSTYSVRIRATDFGTPAGQIVRSFTINISDANEAPAGLALSDDTLPENEPLGTDVGELSVTDPDAGQQHTFTLVAGVGDADNAKFSISGSTLEVAQVLDFEAQPSYSVRVRATDSGSPAMWVEREFTITVTDTLEPPTADSKSAATDEDAAVTVTLSASDPEGDDVASFATTTSATSHGTLGPVGAIACGGSPKVCTADVQFTPDVNFNGLAGFSYTASDGANNSLPANVSITVNPVNDAPTANPGSRSTNEDTPLALNLAGLVSDVETADADLSYEIVTAPAHGTATATTYTPAADYNGPDSLTYRVTDRGDPDNCAGAPCDAPETSTTETVSITVDPVNDAPTANAGSRSTDEDAPLALNLAGLVSDVETADADLSYEIVTAPAHGTATATTYTPAADYNGPDSLTYRVTDRGDPDGCAGAPCDAPETSTTETVSITVDPVNDAPTANAGSRSTDEDAPLALNLAALVGDVETADADLSYEIVTAPAHGTATATTYTPAADYNGPDSFSYRVTDRGDPDNCAGALCDAAATSTTETVSITVAPVNDVPQASPLTDSVDEDGSLPVELAALVSDVETGDGDLIYTIVTPPSHGNVSGSGSARTYTPAADFNGSDSFSYQVTDRGDPDNCSSAPCDGPETSTTETVSITVGAVNDAPVNLLPAGTVSVVQETDTPLTGISVGDVDAGGDDVEVTLSVEHGRLTVDTAVLGGVGMLQVAGNGTATVTITASLAQINATLADADGLVYRGDSGYTGPDTLTVTTDDLGNNGAGGALADTDTLALNVTPPNDAPVAAAQSVSTDEDTAETITLSASDADGDDPLSFATGTPSHGSLGAVGPVSCNHLTPNVCSADVVYTPAADYTGPDSFTFTASDAIAVSAAATVSITVTPVNDPSVAVDDSATVVEDSGASAIAVLANDTDVDGPITIASASDPANGTVVLTGGSAGAHTGLTYEPDANYCNDPPGTTPDTFMYTLNGGSTATVSVTVTCVDDPPVAVDDSATVGEDAGASAIDVLANDTDVDGGPRVVASASDPANGTVMLTGGSPGAHTGLTYQPDAGYCNSQPGGTPDTFSYELNGGDSATVSVTLTCVDDPPLAVNDSATVGEDSAAAAVAVLANDVNVDGGPMAIASASDPANGTVVLTGGSAGAHTGLTYQPDANYCNSQPLGTPDTFTYSLNGGSTATVSMTVTCAPDDPVVDTSAGSTSYTENAAATVIDAAVTVSDVDAGTTITGATVKLTVGYAGAEDILALGGTHPDITPVVSGDTLTLSGNATVAAYQAALRDVTYRNSSDAPSTAPRTVTFTVTDESARSGSDTKGVTVSAVDDPPVAVGDSATVLEDAAATAITVLTNDTDVDAGPRSVASVTQPATGTVAITGGGTGLTYQPNANYCNSPPGTTLSTFTYTLNGGSSATVSVTVTCVNDAPVADDETFDNANGAIGNTSLVVNDPDDGAPELGSPKKSINGDILAGDSDIDGPGPLTVTAGTFATNDGGSVTIEADGDFTYINDPADNCADTSDFFDYTVSDQNPSGPGPAPGTDTGRVTIAVAGCVWYVSNNHTGPPDNAGTSRAPFNTLAQAETASAANHTVFVFDGDNTSTGYGGDGYTMNAGERLIGEHEGLTVDPDGAGGPLAAQTLHPANPGAHPTLTATSADVVDLDDGNELRGLNIDPSNAGGIAGGTGDTGGGTIDDVNVVNVGTAGTQPGLELSGTTGTFNVSNLDVNNSALGVSLVNAGIVNFAPTGTIAITTAGAKGLDAAGTNMGTSTFDSITVTGSTNGGVSMINTTGTTTFGDLSLTTISGTAPAFALSNAGTVSVPAAGTANVSATGGPAVDVTGTSGATLAFDAVSSTNSANDGINLAGLAAGTFSAASGTITGAAGIAFDLDGGNGDVTYPGTITNGPGSTAEITGRTGGTVTLSGPITETGDTDTTQENGGIAVTGNSGGSTVASNATKTFNTGEDHAIVMGTSDGHTLTLSGGSLDIDTTSGAGVQATASGTLNVTGSANTIDASSATALNVTNTDIGAGGATFQRISSGNNTAAADPANGIVLNGTGSTSGLTVTGNGNTSLGGDSSGGTIQSTTGHGINLANTLSPSLTNLNIQSTGGAGINGTQVSNFTFANGTINNSGNALGESNIAFNGNGTLAGNNINGTLSLTNSVLTNAFDHGLHSESNAGTISNATITGNTITSSTNTATSRGSGLQLIGTGTAATASSLTRATITNNTIRNFPTGAGIQVIYANTTATGPMATAGIPGDATNVIAITNNTARGLDATNRFNTHAIAAVVAGGNSGQRSRGNFNISNNGTAAQPIGNSLGHVINIGANAFATMTATVNNNVIVGNNTLASNGISGGNGVAVGCAAGRCETPNLTLTANNNTISQTDGNGILLVGRGNGAGAIANLSIKNNTVAAPLTGVRPGIRVDAGNSSSVDDAVCLDISGNTSAGSGGTQGIGLRKEGTTSTINDFGIEGMVATATPGIETFVNGLNPAGGGTLLISAESGFSNCSTAP